MVCLAGRCGISGTGLTGAAASAAAGKPDFSIDFGDIKPSALLAAAAAVMLTLGKPLSGAKTFGKVRFNMPKLDSDGSGTVRVASVASHPDICLTVELWTEHATHLHRTSCAC